MADPSSTSSPLHHHSSNPPTSPTTSKRPHPKLQLPPSCDPPSVDNPPKPLVWIVFGATGHIGRSLIRRILTPPTPTSPPFDSVTAVGRLASVSASSPSTEPPIATTFPPTSHCLPLSCDVRHPPTLRTIISSTIERFGRIDVIANCAGYGVIGSCEDQSEAEIRGQWEVNFLGTLNIVNASLGYFRKQGGGRYVIFSSTSGALGVPGLGPYCATKYATEALVESMLYEIDHFGIKATLVAPGLVRRPEPEPAPMPPPSPTNPARTAAPAPAAIAASLPLPTYGHFLIKPPSPAYASPTAPAGHMKRMMEYVGSKQPVSAWKASEVVWQLGHCRYPPLRLLLGAYAVESVRERGRCVIEEIEDWKHLSFAMTEGEEREAEAAGGVGGGDGDGDGDGDGGGGAGAAGSGEGEGEGEGEGDGEGEVDTRMDEGDGEG